MGSDVVQINFDKWYEEYKCDLELKIIATKKFLDITFLWINQLKYGKKYLLFNKLPILTIVNHLKGFVNG